MRKKDSMHWRPKLSFNSNEDLRKYYEDHYAHGGYEAGFRASGVDISRIYHAARHQQAVAAVTKLAGGAKLRVVDVGCGRGEVVSAVG